MAKHEFTGKFAASNAGKVLSNPKSTKTMKTVAGSALTQARDRKNKYAAYATNAPRPR